MIGVRRRQHTRDAVARGALALLLGALAAPGGRAALPQAAADTWVEARSERFVVLSNGGEPTAVNAARRLERLAQVLEQTTRGLRVDPGREIRVYVFRDLATFKPYRPDGDDESGITAGFHTLAPDAELIAYHVPPDGEPTRFAAHEYLHAVLRRSLGNLPVWINEGLAEYYSTFSTGARTADIGRPIAGHLEWLNEHSLLPMDGLLAMDPSARDYHEGDRRGTIYAQSWALVHMLRSAGQGNDPRFSLLLGAFRKGLTSRTALGLAYGPNAMDSLATALATYAKRTTFGYSSWRFTDEFVSVPVRTRTLPRAETLVLLGELAARSKESLRPLAREHLEASWAVDSASAVEPALLAELAEEAGQAAEVERWIATVERARSPSPRALAIAGGLLAMRPFVRGYSPSYPARGADATALRARRLLEPAVEAEPGRAEWLVPYGLTFVEDSSELSLGRDALFTAQETEPLRVEAIGGSGMLEVRVGNRAGALMIYRSLSPSGDGAPWRHWVGYLLAQRTLDDAMKRFKAGQHAEAESLLTQLARDVRETGVPATVDRFVSWMHDSKRGTSLPERSVESERASTRDRASGRDAPGAAPPGADPPNTVPGRPAIGATRVGRALAAARRGEFETAERLLEAERAAAPRREQARLDSLQSEVRNQRRMQVARTLVSSGRFAEACVLWRAVLDDSPKPDVRAFANRELARYCAASPR